MIHRLDIDKNSVKALKYTFLMKLNHQSLNHKNYQHFFVF